MGGFSAFFSPVYVPIKYVNNPWNSVMNWVSLSVQKSNIQCFVHSITLVNQLHYVSFFFSGFLKLHALHFMFRRWLNCDAKINYLTTSVNATRIPVTSAYWAIAWDYLGSCLYLCGLLLVLKFAALFLPFFTLFNDASALGEVCIWSSRMLIG